MQIPQTIKDKLIKAYQNAKQQGDKIIHLNFLSKEEIEFIDNNMDQFYIWEL